MDTANTPEFLHHYTNQAGFLGILQSNSVWATKIHYLNDSSEYELALALARGILEKRSTLATSEEMRTKVSCLMDNLTSIANLNVCVCSFSAAGDLLSQWRAYAGHAGVCLTLKRLELEARASDQGFRLAQCVYDESEQAKLLEYLVDDCLSQDFYTGPSYVSSTDTNADFALRTGGDFAIRFAQIAPLIKSSAFREEAEWRLVSNGGINFDRMSFRSGRSFIIPYLPIILGTKISAYLQSVTIGPTPHLARNAVFAFLASCKVADSVVVYGSKVPYRSW
jgi:hypothetical protein